MENHSYLKFAVPNPGLWRCCAHVSSPDPELTKRFEKWRNVCKGSVCVCGGGGKGLCTRQYLIPTPTPDTGSPSLVRNPRISRSTFPKLMRSISPNYSTVALVKFLSSTDDTVRHIPRSVPARAAIAISPTSHSHETKISLSIWLYSP
jgi:hypothetical protein